MGRFIKGLVKDTSPADQPQGTWRFARNTIINKVDGAVSNEGGNKTVATIGRRVPNVNTVSYPPLHGQDAYTIDTIIGWGEPAEGYTVIGAIEITDDRIVLFSVNQYAPTDPTNGSVTESEDFGRSEVGIYSAGEYRTVLNTDIDITNVDVNLKFSISHPISGTYKIDAQGNLFVYWTDDFNPPRCLNITRQEAGTNLIPSKHIYGVDPETSPNKNYVDRLNLFPHSGPVPHVDLEAINSGGGLTTGAYSLALAYVDVDLVATNFLTVDNPVSITDDVESVLPIERYDGAEPGLETGKSITWSVSNINTDYDYIRPVIIQTVGGVQFAYQLHDVEITSTDTEITFTGVEGYTQSSVDEVVIDTVNYSRAKTLEQLDGVLYAGNLEGSLDVGFQKHAGKIKLKPKLKTLNNFDIFSLIGDNLDNGFIETTPPPADRENGYKSIKNAYKYRGYTRDEVYAFYIAFILNDGTMSYAYHIPGRKYTGAELDVTSDEYGKLKGLGPEAQQYNFVDSSAESDTSMNYWRNDNELYPNTDDYSTDDFEDTDDARNVRHHHFPSNSSEHRFYISTGGESIVHEQADVDLVWQVASGTDNCDFNTGHIESIGFLNPSDGEVYNIVNTHTAFLVPNWETLEIGSSYSIDWSMEASLGNLWMGATNNMVATLVSTTSDGWCLFVFVSGNNPNSGNTENNFDGAEITPTSSSESDVYTNVTAGTIDSEINILGFELEDIEIPTSIANKVQGFRIYYAKREHKHKTILGQGVVTPYFASFTQIGGCTYNIDLGNGNDEDLWTKFPFHTSGIFNDWNGFQGHPLNSKGLRTLAFYNFELLRTKDSIAQATHFSVEGTTSYHTWLGSGAVHENSDADCDTKNLVVSTFGILSDYNTSTDLSEARFNVLNERCKSYVKGNSIFDARGLGFGYKLYNRGGESHIALGLDESQELPSVFFDTDYDSPVGGWNTGGVPFNYLKGTRLQTYNINLRAFKTDVYNSLDSQDLVWTGFEVVGDDLDNFIEGANATHNTSTITSEGIFGGDTFICRYGIRQTLYPNLNNSRGQDRISGFYTIIETTDNINFRHETGKDTSYFPGSPAKKFLFADRAGEGHDPENFYDYTDPENTKYNGDYSLVNDIRPAFPLPLLTSQPTSFPTRIQRSAKSDPGSLIDNFRVFLAFQYKDMPKNRGSIWNLTTFNNLLYMHMEDSLFASKGKEKLQLGDASEAFIGSGDIFQQEPDELIQTEAGHGGTRSQYASLVTKYGYFSVDLRNKKIYLTGSQMQDVSNLGMEKWFQSNMPFSLFNDYGYVHDVDNPIEGLGYTSIWDERHQRILLTKRDLFPTRDFQRRFNAGRPASDPLYAEYIPDEVINIAGGETYTYEATDIIQIEDIDFTNLDGDVYVAPPVPTYTLTHDQSSDNVIQEGVTIIFTLTTTNLADSAVPYTISGGVSAADITINGQPNPSLSGVFNIVNGTASITIIALADNTTEAGTENLQVSINEGTEVLSVNIEDTSFTPSIDSIAATNTTIGEGGSYSTVINLVTAGIDNGVTIGYTITGILAADIVGNLTGDFTVNSNAASLTIQTVEDFTTEGPETLTLTLTGYGDTVEVTITDTSQTPVDPTVPIVGIFNATYGGIVINFTEAPEGGYSGYVLSSGDVGITHTWDAALTASGALSQAGFDDWYAPTLTELEAIYALSTQAGGSIGDFSNSSYWSSSEPNNSAAGVVNFSNGEVFNTNKSFTLRARPVRHFNTTGVPVVGVFSPELGGIVGKVDGDSTDGYTGFVVNTVDLANSIWDTAVTNAAALATNGVTWKLPTIEQLEDIHTLYDSHTGAFTGDFATTAPTYYWSSEESNDNYAWTVIFSSGATGAGHKTSAYRVRVISNFDTTPPAAVTYAIGDYIEEKNGYVAFVDETGLAGFVVADTDFTDDTGESVLSWNTWNSMASFTFEGTDWQWPTKEQLELIEAVHTTLEAQAGFNVFNNSQYWSSTEKEFITSSAWYVTFIDGFTYYNPKNYSYRVRGIKAFNYASRVISDSYDESTGITYSLEGDTESNVHLNSVTTNSFQLEHLLNSSAVYGIKAYIPNTYLSFPLEDNDSYTYTVDINLSGSANLLDGSGIDLGDVPLVNAEGDENAEDTIAYTEQTFTPTETENGFEIYFKINLDRKQIVGYTLNTFQITKTTTTTITSGAINADLTQNGAIVLNRNNNKFELIGYTPSPDYYQTRTALDVGETTEIQGVKQFTRAGWTASYYPETKFWGSFHDYIPSLYTYDSGYIYSFDNKIPDEELKIWGENLYQNAILGGGEAAIVIDNIITWNAVEATPYEIGLITAPTFLDSSQTYTIKATITQTNIIETSEVSDTPLGTLINLTVAGEGIYSITGQELLDETQVIDIEVTGVTGIVAFETSSSNLVGFGVSITDVQILPFSYWETESTFNTLWQHDDFNEPGNFYGTTYPFEVEFINNTERQVPKLFSSFGYETEVTNRQYLADGANSEWIGEQARAFQDGFTNFFVYNDTQCSGLNNILYFKHPNINTSNSNTPNTAVRKVGNEWRINDFRDMAYIFNRTIIGVGYTYTGSDDVRVVVPGMYNVIPGPITDYVNMFTVQGMYENINSFYIHYSKPWHQQKKFMDTYIGIRLINDNSRKILVHLYSTSVAMRKYNR